MHFQITGLVGDECLQVLQRFRGGLLGAAHSWVGQAPPLVSPNPTHHLRVEVHKDKLETGVDGLNSPPISVALLHQKISDIVGLYIPDADIDKSLAEQGLDSLASLELRQKLQEVLGVELTSLVEDPQGATMAALAREAASLLASNSTRANARANESTTEVRQPLLVTHQQPQLAVTLEHSLDVAIAHDGNDLAKDRAKPWISPAPVSVKMRLFCIPYAGGVSENVYAR